MVPDGGLRRGDQCRDVSGRSTIERRLSPARPAPEQPALEQLPLGCRGSTLERFTARGVVAGSRAVQTGPTYGRLHHRRAEPSPHHQGPEERLVAQLQTVERGGPGDRFARTAAVPLLP